MDIQSKALWAKQAGIRLSALNAEIKNKALIMIASKLQQASETIFSANKKDIENSEKNCLASPLLKRLKFDDKKLTNVVHGISSLTGLPDPVGKTLYAMELDKGLELYQVSCPIGLIGIIFESRPDALVQISTLCLKSGNAVILKGGSEALHTNRILFEIIRDASVEAGIPEGWIQLLETRDDVNEMLKLDKDIDLIIPRGSNEFVKYIMEHSNIPVLGHADGICHVYIDEFADMDMAVSVATDSKTQYVAVCNAAETILVHEKIASRFLPLLKKKLDEFNVEILGCEKTCTIIDVISANEQTWKTEHLDYRCGIKIVSTLNEAIQHINTYGSKHTDCIVTDNEKNAKEFMDFVDSANVFHNCSTRFSDGYRYGLGAEVGISTNKIHARGPVGLEGLMIYKWKLKGHGHIVADYASGKKSFTHKKII